MDQPRFPEQLDQASFTLDQVRCLASAARAEIFWSFSATDPRSIAEVAEGLGRSASATTYHVGELVEVGLLVAVGERRRRSRVEKLYVAGSRSYVSHSFKESEEYRELLLEGYAAQLRLQLRERTAAVEALVIQPELIECTTYRRFQTRISRDRAAELKTAVLALLKAYMSESADDDSMLISVSFSIAPSLIESKKVTGKSRRRNTKSDD